MHSCKEKNKVGMLHFLNDSIKSLQAKLGQVDKQILNEYLTSVEEKEKELAKPIVTSGDPSCDPKSNPSLALSVSSANYKQWIQNNLDVMYLAFRCDLTPVSIFHPSHDGNPGPRLQFNQWSSTDLKPHGFTLCLFRRQSRKRSELCTREYMKIVRFYVQQFARMIEKMKNTPEFLENGSMGNMLDNSIMIFAPTKSDSHMHSRNDMSMAIVGKGNGNINPGKHHNYATRVSSASSPDFPPAFRRTRQRSPLADLWLTILQSMGVNRTSFADSKSAINLKA